MNQNQRKEPTTYTQPWTDAAQLAQDRTKLLQQETARILTPVKECSKCHEVKDIDEFHMHRGSRDGHQAWCKACVKANDKRRTAVRRKNTASAKAAALNAQAEMPTIISGSDMDQVATVLSLAISSLAKPAQRQLLIRLLKAVDTVD